MQKSLVIYNIFPRLFSSIDDWAAVAERAAGMGFNSIFLNPISLPGHSRSLYAVADYFAYNPDFFPHPEHAEEDLRRFLAHCAALGLDVFMDLVASHTAIDSPLTETHRDWYLLDAQGDIVRPGCWEDDHQVTWGDLAQLDHSGTPDRAGLWGFFREVVCHALSLGFTGFRCDAAYQIEAGFWSELISSAKQAYPHALFLAETLGCSLDDTCRMADSGFDYLFNSSKWWDLQASWCLEAYQVCCRKAPSISFAETHDTVRLMTSVGGCEAAFLQRLDIACFFSAGFMALCGLEYGFTRKPDVVRTTPADWENTGHDYSAHLARALATKAHLAPLHTESPITPLCFTDSHICGLLKEWDGERVLLLINMDVQHAHPMPVIDLADLLHTPHFADYSPSLPYPNPISPGIGPLLPGEVKVFAAAK